MKQKILLCSICVLSFFACKKDKKAPDPAAKLYPISFNLSGFSQTNVPTVGKAKTTALATQATDTIPVQTLYYALLAQNGTLINLRQVNKGDPNFTQFNDNVPAGTYTAVFLGGSSNLRTVASNTPYTLPVFTYRATYDASLVYWDDTFYKGVPLTVTNAGVNLSVNISRVIARLSVVLKDAIPAGITKVVVSFNDGSAINLYGNPDRYGSSITNSTTAIIKTTDIGTSNYTVPPINTLNVTQPFDVYIYYYGADQTQPLGTKIVKNVVCKSNTKTILSGNLFTQGNGQFVITVDQDWNAPVNVNF